MVTAWVRSLAPLNGDDVSFVRLYDRRSMLSVGDMLQGVCTTIVVWHTEGLLCFGFHA